MQHIQCRDLLAAAATDVGIPNMLQTLALTRTSNAINATRLAILPESASQGVKQPTSPARHPNRKELMYYRQSQMMMMMMMEVVVMTKMTFEIQSGDSTKLDEILATGSKPHHLSSMVFM